MKIGIWEEGDEQFLELRQICDATYQVARRKVEAPVFDTLDAER
jgi:hypothetical protein